METSQLISYFLTGLGVGGVSAVVGGLLDLIISRRRADPERQRLPGCMFLEAGALGLAGVLAFILALLLDVSLLVPLIAGAGVVVGFALGFVLMIGFWAFWERIRGN